MWGGTWKVRASERDPLLGSVMDLSRHEETHEGRVCGQAGAFLRPACL